MRGAFVVIAAYTALAGCTCGSSPPEGATTATSGARRESKGAPTGPPLAEKDFYRLDLADAPACEANAPCDVRIALTALAGHHINVEYPTKFVPVLAGDLAVNSTKLTIETQTRAVMSINVTPASAGTHTLHGQFKLGVCTDDKCEIDGPKIELPVTAI